MTARSTADAIILSILLVVSIGVSVFLGFAIGLVMINLLYGLVL
jgi:hypothetical protein